jgi:hypothetical protein
MSDRALWLAEWCPTCRVAPAARCRMPYLTRTRAPTRLHVARGWRVRPCPTCRADPGEACRHPLRTRGVAHASGAPASRTARARDGRSGLATARIAERHDRDRAVQRPRRPGRSGRPDRAEPPGRRRSGRRRAVDRTRRALPCARGACLGSVRLVRRTTADRRHRGVDHRRPARGDRGPTRWSEIRGARVTSLEAVPPRRTRSASARGPPARACSETRKTGLAPGLPNIGAVSAEQDPVHAVYRAKGRNPRPGRSSARCHGGT